jgi:hypothetical protein
VRYRWDRGEARYLKYEGAAWHAKVVSWYSAKIREKGLNFEGSYHSAIVIHVLDPVG